MSPVEIALFVIGSSCFVTVRRAMDRYRGQAGNARQPVPRAENFSQGVSFPSLPELFFPGTKIYRKRTDGWHV